MAEEALQPEQPLRRLQQRVVAEELPAARAPCDVLGEDERRHVAAPVLQMDGREAVLAALLGPLTVRALVPGDEDGGAAAPVPGRPRELRDHPAQPRVARTDRVRAAGAARVHVV